MSETVERARDYTTVDVERKNYKLLGILADMDDRSKKDEVAFLIKERAKQLGVKA